METPIRIPGIARSLRRGSYNRAALRASTELAPKGASQFSLARSSETSLSEAVNRVPVTEVCGC
jgi:hypothetical protein